MVDWTQVYNNFDPEQPVVEHPEWRVERTQSPVQQVCELLDLPVGPPRVLLTGTVGSGKSTELHRIARARTAKQFVLLLDLDRHFTRVVGDPAALRRIAPWEVCFLVGVALARAAEERLGEAFSPETLRDLTDAWRRAAKASDTPEPAEFDLGALGRAMVMFASVAPPLIAGSAIAPGAVAANAGINALKEAVGGAKWKLAQGRSAKRLLDQDDELRGLLLIVNHMLGEIQTKHAPVLLVIDGLDRITDVEHARAVFVDSTMLSQFACATVVCGPYALRHRPELAQMKGFRPVTLVNEAVMDFGDPLAHGPGIAVFERMFATRVAGAVEAVEPDALRHLAWCSGGRARDFVRLTRMLAERVLITRAARATRAHVDAVVDEARRLRETGLHKGHIEIMEALARDPERQLPADPEAWNLLHWDCVLPYPNGGEWYCPHPLLLLRMVKPWKTGSSA